MKVVVETDAEILIIFLRCYYWDAKVGSEIEECVVTANRSWKRLNKMARQKSTNPFPQCDSNVVL